MSSENMSTCITCGKEYKICMNCHDYKSWRSTACCEQCYQVAEIINQYFYNIIDADSAMQQLEDIDYGEIPEFTELTNEYVDKIMHEANPQ